MLGIRFSTPKLSTFAVLCATAFGAHTSQAKVDVNALLRGTDQARGFSDIGAEFNIVMTCKRKGMKINKRSYLIKSFKDKALALAVEPHRSKRDGAFLKSPPAFWKIPGNGGKVRSISFVERGKRRYAPGDMIVTGFSLDYEGKFVKEEQVEKKKHLLLELKPKVAHAVFRKVLVWIDAKTNLATKAEYFQDGKNLLYTNTFSYGDVDIGGKKQPMLSGMTVDETSDRPLSCKAEFSGHKQVKLDEATFDLKAISKNFGAKHSG